MDPMLLESIYGVATPSLNLAEDYHLILSFRLSEELQRHVKQSGKFENLTQGGLRLNHLIERYEMLYSQGRIDALDELDEIPQLKKMKKREEIKSRIMVGVMIVSILSKVL